VRGGFGGVSADPGRGFSLGAAAVPGGRRGGGRGNCHGGYLMRAGSPVSGWSNGGSAWRYLRGAKGFYRSRLCVLM